MSFGEVLGIIVAICGLFVTVVIFMQRSRNEAAKQFHMDAQNNVQHSIESLERKIDAHNESHINTSNALGRKVDENRSELTQHKHVVTKDYYDKQEVERQIEIINKPYLTQVQHLNDKVDKIEANMAGMAKTMADIDKKIDIISMSMGQS